MTPKPEAFELHLLIGQIENGEIKLPEFQRDFVWNLNKSAELIDSLLRGFPIGTFTLWETKEPLAGLRNIGKLSFPDTQGGESTKIVLDGQQRLTSIIATFKGLEVRKDRSKVDFRQLKIDLDKDLDDEGSLVITNVKGKRPDSYVAIHSLLSASVSELHKYPEKYHEKMQKYSRSLWHYNASTVVVRNASIEVATEIFTRINTTGKALDVFDIMVAKTYDTERDFDLRKKTDDVVRKLEKRGYGKVSKIVILQAISAILERETKQRTILGLDKQEFIDTWPKASRAFVRSVDYLRDTIGVPISKLLPYRTILVPMTYFFYNTRRAIPPRKAHNCLVDYFWRTSLAEHYSQSQDTKLGDDIKRMDRIIAGERPSYDYAVDPNPELIRQRGKFNVNNAFVKAILCLLAGNEPRRFDNHSTRISFTSSINYHHFFPKKLLEGKGYSSPIDHIVNITILDEELNKRIGTDSPSLYMRRFLNKGRPVATLGTHFIEKRDYARDDYDTFFEQRCSRIAKELKKKLIGAHDP